MPDSDDPRSCRAIRGVLFDKDGTLLDYAATWMTANRAAALAAAGGDRELSQRLLVIGGYDPDRDRVGANTALAAGNDAPALVKLLVNLRGNSERRVAENAVVAACKRRTQDRSAPVLASLPSATGKARVSLLKVLGRIGGAKSLMAVRGLLNDKSAAIRDAAIRALADWPDPEPMPDLLALAKGADQEVHRVLALWGYVRMIGLAGEDGPRETTRVGDYERAWQVARRDEERKLILAGLSDVNDIAAL